MRVLYLNPEHHDHQHATLIDGLSRLRGVELVTSFPASRGRIATRCLHGDKTEVERAAHTAEAVIFGTVGKDSELPPVAGHLLSIGKPSATRWILVDSGDFGSLPAFAVDRRIFDAVIKRELLVESATFGTLARCLLGRTTRHTVENRFSRHPLVPFPNTYANALARPTLLRPGRRTLRLDPSTTVRCEPIGIPSDRVMTPIEHPKRLVTCTLTPNIDARRRILRHVQGDPRVLSRRVYPEHSSEPGAASDSSDPYLDLLRSHRASISFPGGGFDSARLWEILATGSLLISKRVTLDLPVPLRDGVHYVGFDSLLELDEAIAFAVSDSAEVDTIRIEGHEALMAHYTSAAIARRFAANELAGVSS